MGKFDRTICDCCVCPMQSVLQQLVGIDFNFDSINTIKEVAESRFTTISSNNFLTETSKGSFPTCNITAVGVDDPDFDFTLKPLRNDQTGECSCCEDPAANKLKSLTQKLVNLEFLGDGSYFFNIGVVEKVGEGIVVLSNPNFNPPDQLMAIEAVSICYITKIVEMQ